MAIAKGQNNFFMLVFLMALMALSLFLTYRFVFFWRIRVSQVSQILYIKTFISGILDSWSSLNKKNIRTKNTMNLNLLIHSKCLQIVVVKTKHIKIKEFFTSIYSPMILLALETFILKSMFSKSILPFIKLNLNPTNVSPLSTLISIGL